MMHLSKQQGNMVFIVLVAVLNTAVMSFGILWSHQPIDSSFGGRFLRDFGIGCCISVPVGFVIVPLVRKWVDSITTVSEK